MKAKPVLFSAPMIRALLEGRKTQTRRIIKPQPQPNGGKGFAPVAPYKTSIGTWTWVLAETGHGDGTSGDYCPYGQPGDLLWVRESFYLTDDGDCTCPVYAANDADVAAHIDETRQIANRYGFDDEWKRHHLRLRPSIYMPRWASRLTLEITDVRVQRLQDINVEDARSEGWSTDEGQHPYGWFRDLWQSINGPESWRENPWIWALSFTVHKQNIDEFLHSHEYCERNLP